MLRTSTISHFEVPFLVGLAGVLAVVALTAQGNGDNTIYACANRSGQLRVMTGGACKVKEVPLHWSIIGPAGPTGPKGDTGAPGTVSVPDGRCWSNEQRYVDCGNGTVADQVTGLIWLQQAGCLLIANYADANIAAQALKSGECGLTDNSVAGQWRLPTKAEWEATTARAVALGCQNPALTDNAGTACYRYAPDGPGAGQRALYGVVTNHYWSSSTDQDDPFFCGPSQPCWPPRAWPMNLGSGSIIADGGQKDSPLYVWPVRGGSF
jgi:hypothetical protein